jgi:tyramine---L-glutamate ligase
LSVLAVKTDNRQLATDVPRTRRYDTCRFPTAATMRVFVHEFFCSGAFDGPIFSSATAREGLAMLRAIVEDFARCPGCRVVTTLDRRLDGCAIDSPLAGLAEIHSVADPENERVAFRKLASGADATFVIAPETNGELFERRKAVDAAGGCFLGPSTEAIQLCSDKIRFAEHFQRHHLPTIPTAHFARFAKNSPFAFPIVVKPRHGAGSQDTYLICDAGELSRLRRRVDSTLGAAGTEAIVQPFVAGTALSVSAIVPPGLGAPHVFPIGEQLLSDDGRFQYRGGRLPARPQLPAHAAELVAAACRCLPGLCGYIGFDLVLTDDGNRLVFVEANPRLTTSYLGYRCLARENLAARILDPECSDKPIGWRTELIEFTAEGMQ